MLIEAEDGAVAGAHRLENAITKQEAAVREGDTGILEVEDLAVDVAMPPGSGAFVVFPVGVVRAGEALPDAAREVAAVRLAGVERVAFFAVMRGPRETGLAIPAQRPYKGIPGGTGGRTLAGRGGGWP